MKRPWVRSVSKWLAVLAIVGAGYVAITYTGLKVAPVLSNSMMPVVTRGDASVYVSSDIKTPQVGDIVVFTASIVEGRTITVVHRWVGTNPDGSLITQGDNNPQPDPWFVTTDDVIGTYVGMLPTHYFRNPWTIPVGAGLLTVFIVGSLVMKVLGRDEETVDAADAESVDDVRRSFTALPSRTRLPCPDLKVPAERDLDWYSGGEDWPGAPSRFPWLEPFVRIVEVDNVPEPVLPEDNTFAHLVEEMTGPIPIIPEGWTPAHSSLPADPEDIYLAPSETLPNRPHRRHE